MVEACLDFIDKPIYYHGFPWRTYDEDSLLSNFYKLRKKLINDNPIFPLKISRIAYDCTDCVFQYSRLQTSSVTNMSCIDYWFRNSKKIIKYREQQKYNKDLFGTIVFMKRAPSHFSPYVAGMIYKYFNAKNILDPYAGWGDRCIAAMALDINYIGVDSNTDISSCYKQIISKYPHTKNIKFINNKYENVTIQITPDLIFTSPPFWNEKQHLVERYSNCDKSWEEFCKNSLYKLFSLYQNKIPIVMYVDDYMYKLISVEFGPCKSKFLFDSSTNKKGKKYTHHTIYCW